MRILFENKSDVIVYSTEHITSLCRPHHYIFTVQRVWWLQLLLGLQQGLILHIDNLALRSAIGEMGISKTPQDISRNRQVGEVSVNLIFKVM
jgi:hypothetical protein